MPDKQNIFDDALKNSKTCQKSQMNALLTEYINAKRIKAWMNAWVEDYIYFCRNNALATFKDRTTVLISHKLQLGLRKLEAGWAICPQGY